MRRNILSALPYLSGVIAAVIYFLENDRSIKAHAFQGLVLAFFVWVLEFFSRFFRDFLRPLYDVPFGLSSGNILALIASLIYYVSVFLGLLALAGIDFIFIKERKE